MHWDWGYQGHKANYSCRLLGFFGLLLLQTETAGGTLVPTPASFEATAVVVTLSMNVFVYEKGLGVIFMFAHVGGSVVCQSMLDACVSCACV